MLTDTPSFTREWLRGGRILAYRIYTTDKHSADLWYAETAEVFRTWNEPRPLHLLIDLSTQSGLISAQALARARQLSHVRPDLPGRSAIMMGTGIAAQVLSALVRSGLAAGVRQRMIFTHEPTAIEWLLQRDSTSTAEINRLG